MKKNNFMLGLALAALFTFSFAHVAQAITVNISAATIPLAGKVQLIKVVGEIDSPNAAGNPGLNDTILALYEVKADGSLDQTKPINLLVSTNPDTGVKSIDLTSGGIEVDNGNSVFLRVWSSDNPGVGQYTNSNSIPVSWGITTAFVDLSFSFNSPLYAAGAPATGPSLAVIEESLVRNFNSDKYDLTLKVQLTPPAGYELAPNPSKYKLQVSKKADFSDVDQQNGPVSLSSNQNVISVSGNYYTPGSYYMRAQAFNYFSADGSPWQSLDPTPWLTKSGGSGPTSFTLTLYSGVSAGKPGINFFSMPFSPNLTVADDPKWFATKADGTALQHGGIIRTAYDLVNAINDAASTLVVSTFGKWDNKWDPANPNAQKQLDVGVVIPEQEPDVVKATLNSNDYKLKQGEGYQVYIGNIPNPPGKIELIIKNFE